MLVKCIDGSNIRLIVGKVYNVKLESGRDYILENFPKGENIFPKKLFVKEEV